jgi:hypothetical protein
MRERECAAPAAVESPPSADAKAAVQALTVEKGNVVRAAARLGMTRARLRRIIEAHRIDVAALRS